MTEGYEFIKSLYKQLHDLHESLRELTKTEELLEGHILVKSGFIIRHYSLKLSALRESNLSYLQEKLNEMLTLEKEIKYSYQEARKNLYRVEKAYNAYHGTKLKLEIIMTQYMNNAFDMSHLLQRRIGELIEQIKAGIILHPQQMGQKAHNLLKNIEKTTNQIIKFIDLLEQLNLKISKFEEDSFYPSPRTYGRIMSAREFGKMKATGQLSSRQEPTPVFDCPQKVRAKLQLMSKDDIGNFFRAIGVRSVDKLVIFQTRLKPVVGPVPQSNGLLEYKFPRNTPVEFLEAA